MAEHSARWGKLDNTAHLFPIIATKRTTNVFRESVELTEQVEPVILELALESVIKLFPFFKVHLRKGFFWYYLEENYLHLPLVKIESEYPCTQFGEPSDNGYLFRVSCWKKRINVEFFHALTDGAGAQNFLKELVFHYLALTHRGISKSIEGYLGNDTSLNREDSFFTNFTEPKKIKNKETYYTKQQVYHIKGDELHYPRFSIIHGYFSLEKIKKLAKDSNVTINQYLVALYAWCLYCEQRSKGTYTGDINIAVPVNLRPLYGSITTKNFFVMAQALFTPKHDNHSFEDILFLIQKSLTKQISKEHLESIVGFNVSNEKSLLTALVPLLFKRVGVKLLYKKAAMGSTTTASNFGKLTVPEKYKPYIQSFHGILPISIGQPMKVVFSSFEDTFCTTFSSVLESTAIQQHFFSFLSQKGIDISIETNGEYDESM